MTDGAQYVTTINPHDVLFGRGSGPNDHEGNIRFRDKVAQHKEEYMATNHRQTKAKIAREIVDSVLANNGRFLKRLEQADIQRLGFANGMDVYQIVDDDTVMEKAKQALRQNRDKASSGSTPSMKSNAQQATASMPPRGPPGNSNNNLPPVFAQGNQGHFGMPNPITTGMLNPLPAFSMNEQQQQYREDADGYATYTTILDDPEDDKLFENTARRMQGTMGGPSSNSGPRRGSLLGGRKGDANRRESLPMSDVWRRESLLGRTGESMQMSELMESFKGMSTNGELNSSSDTIGTIEGNALGASQMSGISSMSVVSMASSTSLFRTPSNDNDNDNGKEATVGEGGDTFPGPEGVGSAWNNSNKNNNNDNGGQGQQRMSPPGTMNQRGSMIPREAWNSGQLQRLLQAPIEGSSTMLTYDASGGIPRPVQLMEDQPDWLADLGSSSMSILRTADQQSSNSSRPTMNSDSSARQYGGRSNLD